MELFTSPRAALSARAAGGDCPVLLLFWSPQAARDVALSRSETPAAVSAIWLCACALFAQLSRLAWRERGQHRWIERVPFVSYMFLHANWTHVIANSIWLLPFGSVVARRYGTWLFVAFFLVCGIAGAAVHLACNWGSMAPVIGASAAVSGLMGAAFRMLPRAAGRRLGTRCFHKPVLLWSAFWTLINVVAGLTGFGTGRACGPDGAGRPISAATLRACCLPAVRFAAPPPAPAQLGRDA